MVIVLLCCTIACSGGVLVGYVCGRIHQRELGGRRPAAPHEALRHAFGYDSDGWARP